MTVATCLHRYDVSKCGMGVTEAFTFSKYVLDPALRKRSNARWSGALSVSSRSLFPLVKRLIMPTQEIKSSSWIETAA